MLRIRATRSFDEEFRRQIWLDAGLTWVSYRFKIKKPEALGASGSGEIHVVIHVTISIPERYDFMVYNDIANIK